MREQPAPAAAAAPAAVAAPVAAAAPVPVAAAAPAAAVEPAKAATPPAAAPGTAAAAAAVALDSAEISSASQSHIDNSPALDPAAAFTDHVRDTSYVVNELLSLMYTDEFRAKYGVDFKCKDRPHFYLMCQQQQRPHLYSMQAFASVHKLAGRDDRFNVEQMCFHPMFEELIARYTRTRAKPNPVLLATRSSDFCYQLTIHIEALPPARVVQDCKLRLVREFLMLAHVWDHFQQLVGDKRCPADTMIGIPMPFEFVSVACGEYDLQLADCPLTYGVSGELVHLKQHRLYVRNARLHSSLNYMSVERLGPSLQYLLSLMQSQNLSMSLSSALKIYDQLLCRLIVLSRSDVVLGCINFDGLQFGCKEVSNVLYISSYESAVLAAGSMPTPVFADSNLRFASMRLLRRQSAHFVQDLEAAFYLLLAMLTRRLPWDRAQEAEGRFGGYDARVAFWTSELIFNRLITHCFRGVKDSVLLSFSIEMMTLLYRRNRDLILPEFNGELPKQPAIHHSPNSALSAYNSIRSIALSCFRIENPANWLRQPLCARKVEMLLEEAGTDQRAAFDLNAWCWAAIRPSQFFS